MERRRILHPLVLFRESGRRMFRRPFVALLAVNLLLMLATTSLPEEMDGTALVTWCILAALSVFVQSSLTLAAAEDGPDPSADHWIRAAIAKKVFWRLLGTELLLFGALLVAGLFLLVPALFVGAAMGLGMQAAVLERKGPSLALYRSVELTRPDRAGFGTLFAGAYLVPMVAGQAAVYLAGNLVTIVAINLVVTLVLTAGTLALTRAFLQLRSFAGSNVEPAGGPSA